MTNRIFLLLSPFSLHLFKKIFWLFVQPKQNKEKYPSTCMFYIPSVSNNPSLCFEFGVIQSLNVEHEEYAVILSIYIHLTLFIHKFCANLQEYFTFSELSTVIVLVVR